MVVNSPRSRARYRAGLRDKVSSVLAQLPAGTDPPIIDKFAVDAAPVMSVAVSGRRSLREVTELARRQVKEVIETLSGVGQGLIIGGQERAINIYVDPDRLTALGLSIGQVRAAIAQQNVELGWRIARRAETHRPHHGPDRKRCATFDDLIIGHVGDGGLKSRRRIRRGRDNVEPRGLPRTAENGEHEVQLIVRKRPARIYRRRDRSLKAQSPAPPGSAPGSGMPSHSRQSTFIQA